MVNQIVVAGAIVAESMVLIAQRARPPELAGRWELPGGKVAAGETDSAALARELAEELGVEVASRRAARRRRWARSKADDDAAGLRGHFATSGEPQPHDHAALRWVPAAELHDVDWVPADRGTSCRR